MTVDKNDVKLIKDSLAKVMVGTGAENLQHGRDFYKYFFTNFPDLRVYFKGAEKYTAEDVQKSERFEKQGQRILLATHILANTYEDLEVFKAYARETVTRHRQFKMDPALWLAFFTVFVGYLKSKNAIDDDETEAAWHRLGKIFNEECQKHLKASGLPSTEGQTA
ncbi:unnamed protein product, partial [Mesorhabditis belari]|uniref:Globin family profile domain-containing protein n=1 Tax=Mesorhabditis belari TaxID=2138241 RepID=A0AAF3EVZ7_9BILA